MKCVVPGCFNEDTQGDFIGYVCVPCYEYLLLKKGTHSQAYRNDEAEKTKNKILALEFQKELDEWVPDDYDYGDNYIEVNKAMLDYETPVITHFKD